MGYGYLGAYLAFGCGLDTDTSQRLLEELGEDREILACLYADSDFKNIVVKQYGIDEHITVFLCWGPVYKGGEIWKSDICGTPHSTIPVKLLPIPSAQTLVHQEETFDNKEWESFCTKYNLEIQHPQWQTLISFGQLIY